MTKMSDNESPSLLFADQGAAPTTPASGYSRIFTKSDGLYVVDDSGAVTGPFAASGGAGALVFLEAHTASSSASLDFTTFISSSYDDYIIDGIGILLATNGADLYMDAGYGAGPTYDTTNYGYQFTGTATGGTSVTYRGDPGRAILLQAGSNDTGYGHSSFHLSLVQPQSSSLRRRAHGIVHLVNSSPNDAAGVYTWQWEDTTNAMTALRFIPSSGNIAVGTIRIYGVAKS